MGGRHQATGQRAHRRGDIQGLRAIAVLLVLLNHADINGFSGGFVGVDVFFVISGYLITGLLVREIRTTGTLSVAGFYSRRARRILPAGTFVLIVVVVLSGWLLNPLRAGEVQTHAVWAALFAANVYSASKGSGYLAETSFVSPLQHYWSLAVEEQFYLIWPTLIAVQLWRCRSKKRELRMRSPTIVVGLISLLSLAWSIRTTATDPTAAYYLAQTRVWELGLGALLALHATGRARWGPGIRAATSWAGLAFIAFAATSYSIATPFPGYPALLPAVGAALILAASTNHTCGAGRVLDRAPMRWIGDLSYSLYLWHWPILVLTAAYLDRELTPVERLVATAVAVPASWLSYRLIEMPVRRAAPRRPRIRSLAMWPAAVLAVLSTVIAVQYRYGVPVAFDRVGIAIPAGDRPSAGSQNNSQPSVVPQQALVAATTRAADLARRSAPLPRTLRPSLEHLWDDLSPPPEGCSAEQRGLDHPICEFGDPSGSKVIVLLGDSHLAMWMDPIVRAAKARGYRVVPLIKSSCMPIDVPLWRVTESRVYTECDTWRRWADRKLSELKPAHIIMSGRINTALADADRTGPMPAHATREAFGNGAWRTLSRLRTLARDVSVISGTTYLEREALDCLAGRKSTRASCAAPLERVVAERNTLLRSAAVATGVRWVDVTPWFCDARTCPLVIGDVAVYRDNSHVTKTYVETVGAELVRQLGL